MAVMFSKQTPGKVHWSVSLIVRRLHSVMSGCAAQDRKCRIILQILSRQVHMEDCRAGYCKDGQFKAASIEQQAWYCLYNWCLIYYFMQAMSMFDLTVFVYCIILWLLQLGV